MTDSTDPAPRIPDPATRIADPLHTTPLRHRFDSLHRTHRPHDSAQSREHRFPSAATSAHRRIGSGVGFTHSIR